MIVGVESIVVQVDPLLFDGSLEPFLEDDAIFYCMANIPVVVTIQRIINHVYLVRSLWFWKIQGPVLYQLVEHVLHQLPVKNVLLLKEFL